MSLIAIDRKLNDKANPRNEATVEFPAEVEQFERISPNFDLEHLRNFLPDEAVDRYHDGLRAAGWDG